MIGIEQSVYRLPAGDYDIKVESGGFNGANRLDFFDLESAHRLFGQDIRTIQKRGGRCCIDICHATINPGQGKSVLNYKMDIEYTTEEIKEEAAVHMAIHFIQRVSEDLVELETNGGINL